MQKEEIKYWLAFSRINNIGPIRFKKLIKYFIDLKTAWQADLFSLKQAGLENIVAQNIIYEREHISPDNLLEEIDKHNIKVLCLNDFDYPGILKQIYDPPPILYYKGTNIPENIRLAIVGTRKISNYGRQIVKDLIPKISNQQITTVSGLALGIDALVHETTIKTDGHTIAVLGSGLDEQNIYPSSNKFLAKQILATGGSIISEYPPGTMPLKQHFPKRNRIISGLSAGVLIIEGNIKSGSLITARCALDQNRDVMAVPGSIYSENSSGTNELIKQGATMITNIEDILNCLNIQTISTIAKIEYKPIDETEEKILSALGYEPISVDEIIRKTGIKTAKTTATLSLLEMKGVIKNIQGNEFVKTK